MDTVEKVKKEKNTTTMRNINARFNSFTSRHFILSGKDPTVILRNS